MVPDLPPDEGEPATSGVESPGDHVPERTARRAPVRVCADTSVFGGVFDEGFEESSRAFFEQVAVGRFRLVASALVQREVMDAPERVREFARQMMLLGEMTEASDAAQRLWQAYMRAGIVTANHDQDALHVALATVAGCAMIVSWNFRHIVHSDKVPLYNAVDILQGFAGIAIWSPLEVIPYEEG